MRVCVSVRVCLCVYARVSARVCMCVCDGEETSYIDKFKEDFLLGRAHQNIFRNHFVSSLTPSNIF